MYHQTSGTMRTAHKTTHYIYIYIYGCVIINNTGTLWFVTTAVSGHALPLQACKTVKIQQVWST